MKKLLITGGSGLIGSALVTLLRSRYRITVLTRNVTRTQRLLGLDISCISNLEEIKDIGLFYAVINLAGEPIANKRWTSKQKDKICQSRWQLTQKLVTMIEASATPPEVFISGSAIGIYGRQPEDKIIDESFTDYHNEFSHTVCSTWEATALQLKGTCRVVILRTGIVLARNQGMLKKIAPLFYLCLGGSLGAGNQIMSWIHISDMVRGIYFLLTNDFCEGVFHLTAPEPVSNAQFTRVFSEQLHRPARLNIPAFIQQWLFGELSDLFLHGQNVIPDKLLNAGFEFQHVSLKSALQDLYG